MRLLLPFLLAPALLAQGHALPEPGVSPSLREDLRASVAATPHDLFIRDLHQPVPEATVEIVEALSPAEIKQRAFEAFKVFMLRSLAEYLGRYEGTPRGDLLASNPPGGDPQPKVYPMGKALDF